MSVIRVVKNSNYTVMSNYHFKNNSLSFKAMGLLSFMLSLPDDWNYSVEGLVKCAKDGRDSIIAGLKELENAGYLIRRKIRNNQGQIIDTEYVIYEEPINNSDGEMIEEESPLPIECLDHIEDKPFTENPKTVKSENDIFDKREKSQEISMFEPFTENPETVFLNRKSPFTGKPHSGKPHSENPQQLNTNILSTNILNTKSSSSSANESVKSKNDDDINELKEKIKYDAAVKASSEEIASSVFQEIVKRKDLMNVINANLFMAICRNIIIFSGAINNKTAYIQTCINNIVDARNLSDGIKKRQQQLKHGFTQNTYDFEKLEKDLLQKR